MKITDEQLSAFLDNELSESEMETVRKQLIEDENLANRLAELAMVDQIVSRAYAQIDSRSLPDTLSALLAKNKTETATIIAFPAWKNLQKNFKQPFAIAASVALVFTAITIQLLHKSPADEWKNIAQVLEISPSGVVQITKNDLQIKPRATFINKTGEYCRQFTVIDKNTSSENIACRTPGENGQWQQIESIAIAQQQAETYQPASGNSSLDEKLESLGASEFFDAQTETLVISQRWVIQKKSGN